MEIRCQENGSMILTHRGITAVSRSHQVPSWLTPGAAVQVRNGGTPGADLPGAIVEVKGPDGKRGCGRKTVHSVI